MEKEIVLNYSKSELTALEVAGKQNWGHRNACDVSKIVGSRSLR